MKSIDSSDLTLFSVMAMGAKLSGADKSAIRVRTLSERDCRRLLMHFLSLDDNDRLLRFGSELSDETITRYVQKLDFSRNAVFGVYDDDLNLLGAGHLVFRPKETHSALLGVTTKARIAEFGVSVVPHARGRGIGVKLFERAAIHCRNEDVDVLYMHCLGANQTMIHIARKVGMEVRRDRSESDVYLQLLPAGAGRVLHETMEG